LDDGTAVVATSSLDATGATMGAPGESYARLMGPLVAAWPVLCDEILGPLRLPGHPFALARFGLLALRSAAGLARGRLAGEPARGFFAGLAAHSMLSLEHLASASFGLVLGVTAHAVGWPMPRGGAQRLADALAAYLRSLGGELVTGTRVESLD